MATARDIAVEQQVGARRSFAATVTEDPARAAFFLLRTGFTVAPILLGLDKFFNWMTDWTRYLWVGVADFLPGDAQQIMYGVGVLEIVTGLVVLMAPIVGAALVATWLGAIIINLIIIGSGSAVPAAAEYARPDYWDIALRDFGLIPRR